MHPLLPKIHSKFVHSRRRKEVFSHKSGGVTVKIPRVTTSIHLLVIISYASQRSVVLWYQYLSSGVGFLRSLCLHLSMHQRSLQANKTVQDRSLTWSGRWQLRCPVSVEDWVWVCKRFSIIIAGIDYRPDDWSSIAGRSSHFSLASLSDFLRSMLLPM
jgi:hypothetical protein